ncbi:MAG: hypothetical protein CMD23_01330 [Flavobacteriales bacterium]|nr:hypothetical protein [Flavobacteriales bacterium]
MRLFFLLTFFVFFVSFSQNLPEQYYFSDNNQRLIRGGQELAGFYSELEIDTIFLYFDQSDYWTQMLDNYCDKINISATMLYNGLVFNEVGVRFKGQTSFFNTNGSSGGGGPGGGGPGGGGPGQSVDTDKKSFNIELDWVNNQDIDGYETLNLNNCYQDPSFLREFIFEKLSRNHIPAVKVNFVQLMINDQNWGIYANVQQLDKQHAKEWFFDDECTRWRAEDPNSQAPGCGAPSGGPGGGGPGSGPDFGAGTSSMNYLGLDTLNYMNYYTLKKSYTEDPWSNLVNACQVVDEVSQVDDSEAYAFLNEYLDLDATLWHLANEIIFSDDDSYINKGGMDYYIYYDKYNQRILPIEYDGNTVFGNTNWSPFYHEDDIDFALLNKLLSIPSLRQRYLAHFRTILINNFNADYINNIIDEYANMIDSYVFNDPQKIYTYTDFLNEVEDLKDYFSDRSNYLWLDDEVSEEGVSILNVEYYVDSTLFAQPSSSDDVLINVELNMENLTSVNLYYGTGLTGRFNMVEMDYSFSTGNYTYMLPAASGGEYVRFYIESIAENGVRVYSPEGAEHDVYIYQVKMDELVYSDSDIVINEIMASNDFTVADEAGEYDDWIEIYNKGEQPISLFNYHLSDDVLNLSKYTFPDVILDPNQYFIVWADDDEEEQGDYNHATFNLSASGEQLFLSDVDFNILDEVVFGEQVTDMGFARVPNGTGDFVIQNPTFNYNNDQSSFQIEFESESRELVKTIDLLGRENSNNTIKINIYNNGFVEKIYLLK